MTNQAVQLTIRFGAIAPPVLETIGPDGVRSAFSLPKGKAFVLTDITIFGIVPATVVVAIGQGSGTTGSLRWEYRVSSMDRNFERSFATGLVFTSPFYVIGATPPGQEIYVLISGFLRKA